VAYGSGSFTEFQYQGVITCIPKEGKDRRFIGNWRPISLLNTDLKIASFVFFCEFNIMIKKGLIITI
jgi:hypothetical protein